jgi:hypothetical protein
MQRLLSNRRRMFPCLAADYLNTITDDSNKPVKVCSVIHVQLISTLTVVPARVWAVSRSSLQAAVLLHTFGATRGAGR